MTQAYKPVENSFYELLQDLTSKKAYIRVQYYTDLHELINVTTVTKELIEKEGAEYLLLATGKEVRLDRLVRVGDNPAPGYDEAYFKCDI
ncbi:Rho-binding antiterminator [Pontibacter ummariensis]|uniref:Rho-binding antiterminator n=1 Tax=Pontibacter ummariensis TaxID=1610492 RepID=A0A239J1W4_9BACT|nr:hypothetical protein [Pontibacter ummariensis]PRY08840.1 Rho-binding antiterminator [Pontibacter ummariensis]SNS99810.1 Rho-binding antiterminator [Pontibacter ummariensis]